MMIEKNRWDGMMNGINTFLIRNPVLVFFVLVFVISWSAVCLLAGTGGFPINQDRAMVMGMAILLGPSMACIILTGTVSGRYGFRDLLSRLLKWRAGVHWYAATLLIAPISTVAVLLLLTLYSSEFRPNILLSSDKPALLISGIMGGLIVGLFEELGWTGFAVPRLRRVHSIIGTGVITGVIWGAWHFPLFWEAGSFHSPFPFVLLIVRLFSWLPPYRILMVWMVDHTESLFLAILMHLSLVATLIVLDPAVTDEKLVVFILARAVVLWIIAGLVVLTGRKATS
ncbi:CPBP family intramembrane metalloprotease [bacterium]|nr:CPBP family intramembrane metalloprotease [bacterium]